MEVAGSTLHNPLFHDLMINFAQVNEKFAIDCPSLIIVMKIR